MDLVKTVFKRSIALIILRVSGTLAAGSLLGAEIYVAAGMAAFVGIVEVAEELARAYVTDGKLDMAEINKVFSGAADEEESAKQIERALDMVGADYDEEVLAELAGVDEPDEEEEAAALKATA